MVTLLGDPSPKQPVSLRQTDTCSAPSSCCHRVSGQWRVWAWRVPQRGASQGPFRPAKWAPRVSTLAVSPEQPPARREVLPGHRVRGPDGGNRVPNQGSLFCRGWAACHSASCRERQVRDALRALATAHSKVTAHERGQNALMGEAALLGVALTLITASGKDHHRQFSASCYDKAKAQGQASVSAASGRQAAAFRSPAPHRPRVRTAAPGQPALLANTPAAGRCGPSAAGRGPKEACVSVGAASGERVPFPKGLSL